MPRLAVSIGRHHPFERITPTPEQHAHAAGLRHKLHSLYEDMAAVLPDSPQKTQALLHLEGAELWAGKALTHGG